MAKSSSLRLATVTNEACANPVCQGPIEELGFDGKKVWRRTPRKFCSTRCKQENWILAKAAKILLNLAPEQRSKLLHVISDQWTRELLQALPFEENKEILFDQLSTQPKPDGERSIAKMKRERFPSFSLGKLVKFKAGYFETEDVELQSLIESNEWFRIHIFRADREQVEVSEKKIKSERLVTEFNE